MTDAVARAAAQSGSVRNGVLLQNLGAYFLELGRTVSTVRLGRSPVRCVVFLYADSTFWLHHSAFVGMTFLFAVRSCGQCWACSFYFSFWPQSPYGSGMPWKS